MSRNIKEIGKELLGKSLNSYHRRTGLTQLEENNKMQDGILDGILSQVDDDSIIVPTTTVKYTPKMKSFNTLKEVENNNIMLTNDINDNIIPYMMDVDLMIMEKEMTLMSHKNIRKMEVLDMTSMQKRTQDMLERLIKGKTLTEQECKTRVTTYLNAGKITDEQAEELMLLIDEVYA